MITVDRQHSLLVVRGPFARKGEIKAVPGARWDPAGKAWVFPATHHTARELHALPQCLLLPSAKELLTEPEPPARAWPADVHPFADPTKRPWSHQVRAYAYSARRPGSVLRLKMRMGKTLISLALAVSWGSKLTLVVCPVAVMPVWRDEAQEHVPGRFRVVLLDERKPIAKKAKALLQEIQLAGVSGEPLLAVVNYESVWRGELGKLVRSIEWDLVIADECVERGTVIDTPVGPRAIEDLAIGDEVIGFDHASGLAVATTVEHTFSRETEEPCVNVAGVVMTWNHPVFTAERGYAIASSVDALDTVVVTDEKLRLVRQGVPAVSPQQGTVLRQIMLGEVAHVAAGIQSRANSPNERGEPQATAPDARAARGPGEATRSPARPHESLSRSSRASEIAHGQEGEGLSISQWGQREGHDDPTSVAGGGARMETGIRFPPSSFHQTDLQASAEPEDRHSERRFNDRHRGGWSQSRDAEDQGDRRAPGRGVARVRLDGDPFLEPGNSIGSEFLPRARRRVHNLQTGTGNYFAGGLLVHNCHKLKSPGSSVSMFMAKVRAKHRLGPTGTFLPNGVMDAYAQMRFIDPSIFGTSSAAFKARYRSLVEPVAYKVDPNAGVLRIDAHFNRTPEVKYLSGARWEPRLGCWVAPNSQANRALLDRMAGGAGEQMQDFTKRLSRAVISIDYDEADIALPEQEDRAVFVDLAPAARVAYEQMRLHMIAQVERGEIVAANALVKSLRLSQIASGVVQTDEGDLVELCNAKPMAIRELLEGWYDEDRQPAVVFCRFHNDLNRVERIAGDMGLSYGEISGRRKDGQAGRFLAPGLTLIGVQLQSGGLGLDFHAARLGVFITLSWSASDYEQARYRFLGSRQRDAVTFPHVIARGTVDEAIWTALQGKIDLAEAVMSHLRRR